MSDKKSDLDGPGIGVYDELEKVLPRDYSSLLDPRETRLAITAAKRTIEDGLEKALNLTVWPRFFAPGTSLRNSAWPVETHETIPLARSPPRRQPD